MWHLFQLVPLISDLLNYMLPHIPASLLEVENTTGRSTPLHWAAINAHLSVAQAIVSHPGGLGPLLINAHNAAGLSPLGEAELAGADDLAKWLVEVMTIDPEPGMVEGEGVEEQIKDQDVKSGSRPAQANEALDIKAEKLTLSEDSQL